VFVTVAAGEELSAGVLGLLTETVEVWTVAEHVMRALVHDIPDASAEARVTRFSSSFRTVTDLSSSRDQGDFGRVAGIAFEPITFPF